MQKTVIVLPGLGGESTTNAMTKLVMRWKNSDQQVFVFDSAWHTDESYNHKLARLQKFYDDHNSGQTTLVGYSAGGALATKLLYERPDTIKIIAIAGKIKGWDTIGKSYQQSAPALIPAVRASEQSLSFLPEQKVTFLKPIFDEVVPKRDMSYPGVKVKTIPFMFHATSIVFALLFMVKRRL